MKIIRFNDEWSCWYEDKGEIKGVKEGSRTYSIK